MLIELVESSNYCRYLGKTYKTESTKNSFHSTNPKVEGRESSRHLIPAQRHIPSKLNDKWIGTYNKDRDKAPSESVGFGGNVYLVLACCFGMLILAVCTLFWHAAQTH